LSLDERTVGYGGGLVVGIDATNLRQGGGRTHLVELLRAAIPEAHGISRVVVWGSKDTLARLDARPWLEKVNPSALERGLLSRSLWQRFCLSKAAHGSDCDVLFVPGGSYAGNFHPVVTMSRNMLPFEWLEIRRYGWSSVMLKILLLRWTQARTFRKAQGVIFLTQYAHDAVMNVIKSTFGKTAVIPHGIADRFKRPIPGQRPITDYSLTNPFRILYVSHIEKYKHQWHAAEAVGMLRAAGYPVVLDLVGPEGNAIKQLQTAMGKIDPDGAFIKYWGAIPHEKMSSIHGDADLFLFASSCENMPNILLEGMAAGLPIACSNRGPMPEVLGDAGVYFDPENPQDIARALRELIECPDLRMRLATKASERSNAHSWARCANKTFEFIAEVVSGYDQPKECG